MVNGIPGWGGYYLSAYGIAVKHGFTGTEEEWLDHLKGADIEMRYEKGALQWKNDEEETWHTLHDFEALLNDMEEKKANAGAAALSANTAAEQAEESAVHAKEAGEAARTVANSAADTANRATALANAATEAANAAAGSAKEKAQEASMAAEEANTAASAVEARVQAAQTAAETASAAATSADEKVQAVQAVTEAAQLAIEAADTATQQATTAANIANEKAQAADIAATAANDAAASALEHPANELIHVTESEKAYLEKPYSVYVYSGTGSATFTRVAPCRAKAVLVMCSDTPPIVPRSDGRFDVYWDFWSNVTHSHSGRNLWGLGGVAMTVGTNFETRCKDSETNSDLVLKMNEKGKYYVAIFFPALS